MIYSIVEKVTYIFNFYTNETNEINESFLIELKWVNFHVDPILRISRILNFPQNEIHTKYQKNFPFVKLKPCELSLKLLSVEFNQRKK